MCSFIFRSVDWLLLILFFLVCGLFFWCLQGHWDIWVLENHQWMFFFNEYIKGFCDYSIKILILVQIFLNSVIIFMDVILSFLGMWRRRLRRDCFCCDSTRFIILFYHLLWHSNSVWLTFWLFSVSVELPGQRLRNKHRIIKFY